MLALEWPCENCYAGDELWGSGIDTLPYLKLDPSNPSTIYTDLCHVQTQCEKVNLSLCPVTIDQPLDKKYTEKLA